MPLYEFACKSCNKITEKMMKMSDPHPTECDCGAKNQLEKIISKTSFVLKGTGWYETDFKAPASTSKEKPASTKAETKKSSEKPAPAKEKQSSDT